MSTHFNTNLKHFLSMQWASTINISDFKWLKPWPVAAMWAMRTATSMKRLSSCALATWEKDLQNIWKEHINQPKDIQFTVFKITKHTNWNFVIFPTLHNFIEFLPRIEWNLANLIWYGVVARVRSCEAKTCICSYSHPRLFQQHFSRQAMTSRPRSAFCIILLLCFDRTFIFHDFSLCGLAKAQS